MWPDTRTAEHRAQDAELVKTWDQNYILFYICTYIHEKRHHTRDEASYMIHRQSVIVMVWYTLVLYFRISDAIN